MDMACRTLACEPAFVQAAVPQRLSKGVLKKCETKLLIGPGMDYCLSFYIKMSVLLTGASWRADHVIIISKNTKNHNTNNQNFIKKV